MIRWGTLMAGMLGFIMVLALGLSMGTGPVEASLGSSMGSV